MFNLAKGIVKSARNQNQPLSGGASGSKNSIQPPHVSNELLETQRNRAATRAYTQPEPTHVKELNQWVMQAPIWEKEDRQKAVSKILSRVEHDSDSDSEDDYDLGTRTMELQISTDDLFKPRANPKEINIFFEGASKLSNLTSINLYDDRSYSPSELFKTTNTVKLLFEHLGKLNNLKRLTLFNFNFGEHLQKPEEVKALFESIGNLRQLKILKLDSCNLGELLENPETTKLFFGGLGELNHLKELFLRCNLIEGLQNHEKAKVFFEILGKLNQLKNLTFSDKNFDKLLTNSETTEVFFQSLGKLISLEKLAFYDNSNLGKILIEPQMANAFVEALVNLSKLRHIYLGENYTDLSREFVRCIKEKNQQNTLLIKNNTEAEPDIVVEAIQNNTESECDIIVEPIQDGIETTCMRLLEKSHAWSDEINEVLLTKSKTVADAIFACQLLVYMGPSDDTTRPNQLHTEDVQNNINAVCLTVLDKLTNVNSNNPNVLETRNQEIANLSRVVQYFHANRYLTAGDLRNFNLHLGNIQGLNKAFDAIEELQNNQKTIVQGIQSLGDIVHQNTQRIDDLHKQCGACFEYVMKEYSDLQQDLKSTQEHLKSTLDSLHEIGQKRLMAARIKAVSGTALSAVALIPFVGACIAEGSRAIANAFSIAGALSIFDRIEILKESIADAARGSRIEGLSEEIRQIKLGELLRDHGMPLPSNNDTIQKLADVTLGDLSETASNSISKVADHHISDLEDAAMEQAGTAFGEISAAMSNHSFPNNAQTAPAILPTQQRATAGQATRSQAIAPTSERAPLQRNDSTGSLATVDEKQDELAAAIKRFDTSDSYSLEYFNDLLQKAIKAERVKSGSTSLTTKTLPTRNSDSVRATAMDLAAHYGRPQVLKAMDTAARATSNDTNPVELQSAQERWFSGALDYAKDREGIYNRSGKRIAPRDDQAN